MKLRWLTGFILLIGIIIFGLLKLNEGFLIKTLTPLFPSSDEHPPMYYADIIRLIVQEFLWITIFFAAFLYLNQSPRFQSLFGNTEKALLKNPRHSLAVILAFFLVVTLIIGFFALRNFPNSADEYAYLFQAADISQGKLWSVVHTHPDFFDFHHIVQKDAKWMGRFPPGWPLVLSLGFLLSIPPVLINVIISLLGLFFFYKLTKKLYDERIALWSLIAVAGSSFYLFNAASFFSHSISFLHVVLAIYLSLLYFDSRKAGWALLAGVFVGMLAMTRPFTAVLIFGPFYLYLLLHHRARVLLPFLLISIGAAPCLALLFWYNYKTTGNPFLPVTIWAYPDETLGFSGDHTPAQGLKHIFKRLALFIYWVSPHFLILYGIYLLLRLKNLKDLLTHPEDYFFLILIVGYFFYYSFGGNQYGPRFYLEGFPFLVTFILVKALRQQAPWGRVLFLTGILFSLVKIPFITAREHKIVNERMDIYDKVADAGIKNAVVLIASPTGVIRPMNEKNLNRNDKAYANPVLFALDLGQKNAELREYYPDKKFYKYIRDENVAEGRLIEVSDSPQLAGPKADPEEQSQ